MHYRYTIVHYWAVNSGVIIGICVGEILVARSPFLDVMHLRISVRRIAYFSLAAGLPGLQYL